MCYLIIQRLACGHTVEGPVAHCDEIRQDQRRDGRPVNEAGCTDPEEFIISSRSCCLACFSIVFFRLFEHLCPRCMPVLESDPGRWFLHRLRRIGVRMPSLHRAHALGASPDDIDTESDGEMFSFDQPLREGRGPNTRGQMMEILRHAARREMEPAELMAMYRGEQATDVNGASELENVTRRARIRRAFDGQQHRDDDATNTGAENSPPEREQIMVTMTSLLRGNDVESSQLVHTGNSSRRGGGSASEEEPGDEQAGRMSQRARMQAAGSDGPSGDNDSGSRLAHSLEMSDPSSSEEPEARQGRIQYDVRPNSNSPLSFEDFERSLPQLQSWQLEHRGVRE